ncbi:MAG: hypothetical protein HGA80_01725 [Candidatus Omnitrophica bacterium]|nr:hypothetical protein [Candidatus Omnitrophota bacterium]
MDERKKLRKALFEYPGATEESVERLLIAYEQREEEKRVLIKEHHYGNSLAEYYLDKKGYPRPPGWHSVFFYPGSNRPRNHIVFWGVALGIVAWFFFK